MPRQVILGAQKGLLHSSFRAEVEIIVGAGTLKSIDGAQELIHRSPTASLYEMLWTQNLPGLICS